VQLKLGYSRKKSAIFPDSSLKAESHNDAANIISKKPPSSFISGIKVLFPNLDFRLEGK